MKDTSKEVSDRGTQTAVIGHVSRSESSPSAANDHRRGWLDPTFVDGIGPPLEQLEQDYRNVADLENDCMARDVLVLIKEVKTLRWELAK